MVSGLPQIHHTTPTNILEHDGLLQPGCDCSLGSISGWGNGTEEEDEAHGPHKQELKRTHNMSDTESYLADSALLTQKLVVDTGTGLGEAWMVSGLAPTG